LLVSISNAAQETEEYGCQDERYVAEFM